MEKAFLKNNLDYLNPVINDSFSLAAGSNPVGR